MSRKHDAQELPELGANALELLGKAEFEKWQKARPEDVARQTGRRNCYHCGTDFETCPRETHEIIAKGMGGSDLLLDPRNRIDLCAVCHKRAQPSDGATIPTLRFFRRGDGMLRSLEEVSGAWEEVVPYGALVAAEDVQDELHVVQALGTKLVEHSAELERWSDEALKTEFENSEQAGTVLFVTQCKIVAILAARRSIVGGRKNEDAGLKGTAKYLGISYNTARERNAIYNSIIKRSPLDEWYGLSTAFFQVAYRSKEHVDPVEALRYAQDRLLANPQYTKAQFAEHIKQGLPQEDIDEGSPSAQTCPYDCERCMKAPSTATIELYDGETMVARGQAGSGAGMAYCNALHRLASSLVGNDASVCPYWRPRARR